jgi:hypothetical protein
MTTQPRPLRPDITPEAVESLLLAADNMPLNREGQVWHGAANWLRERARLFALAFANSTARPAAPSLRDALAEAIYNGHDQPDWLPTVDGTPNSASYEYADRALSVVRRAGAGEQRVEYGLKWDCEANGCAEPCVDDDSPDGVMVRGTTRPVTQRVNRHAVTVVQRTVTYSAWEQPAPLGPAPEERPEQ